MVTSRSRRPAWARAAAAATLLVAAGCGGGSSEAGSTPASATDESSPAGQAADLEGTWQTPDIPLEEARVVYEDAGGSSADAEAFVDQLGSGSAQSTIQFQFHAHDGVWDQYERADHGEAERGWTGTYTVDGDVVHAREADAGCAIDYRATLEGDQLTLEVLRDEGQNPECSSVDLLAQRTIYESAPFSKVE
ncbi:hypothetical protein LY71_1268 [Geodermatophilus tzadiensis]|uniref:Lipocalin-like protein n=1 Tax=Geodermatophilus tzadiensis TaxID=1137988 RepID=A0A2T0SRL1_9ACTN|nr:hypothetical protein [Geodermatophilus tzadiensis]PRY36047.1 hypothetical protein LY71_1268 [Geodermatophilus tzadiensis]